VLLASRYFVSQFPVGALFGSIRNTLAQRPAFPISSKYNPRRWCLCLLGYAHYIRLSTMKKMNASLHELYMRLCLKLAEIARERGEVPVGSVVVRDGAVIAEGVEGVRAQYDIAHHAEMEALDSDFSWPIVSMASAEWATAAPAGISAATQIASMISCGLAPFRVARLVWLRMQYGHWVTCATATAISSFVFDGSAASALPVC